MSSGTQILLKKVLLFDVSPLLTDVPLLETVGLMCDFLTKSKIDMILPLIFMKELFFDERKMSRFYSTEGSIEIEIVLS